MLFSPVVVGCAKRAARSIILCGAVVAFVSFSVIPASSVTLAWNPSPSANIGGYKIYYGAASRTYTNTLDVGNTTNTTVTALAPNTTYYFAATAYDNLGLESDYSAEVAYTNLTAGLPTVTLNSPVNGATYAAPATINMTASVTANGHTITSVRFYANGTLLAQDTAAPFSFTWPNVSAGTYYLGAQVVYDSGSTADSANAVRVTVASPRPANTPPMIASIADRTMTTNSVPLTIAFTVGDAETDATNLTLYASSTNLTLLPTTNIVFGGTGSNLTVTLAPVSGQTGEVDIAISVSDGSLTNQTSFHLTVTERVAWTLWWQNASGTLAAWSMDGTKATGGLLLDPSSLNPDWKIVGTGDLNADRKTDILLQSTDGSLGCWFLDGTKATGGLLLDPSSVNPNWRIAGAGDFNRDGKTDILLQSTDGWLGCWFLDRTKATGGLLLDPSWIDPNWKIVGTGDFNRDGKTDILLQSTDGWLGCWFMDGTKATGGLLLEPSWIDPSWKIVGPK